MLLTADRPTTSRWAPLTGGERSYQVRPILEGKNRGRHFVSKTPTPGSHSAFESGLGSAFDPTRTVPRAGTEDSTPGALSVKGIAESAAGRTSAMATIQPSDRAGARLRLGTVPIVASTALVV